jgi:hypothetical protein
MARRAADRSSEDGVLTDDGDVPEITPESADTGPVPVFGSAPTEPERAEAEAPTQVVPVTPEPSHSASAAPAPVDTGPQFTVGPSVPANPGWVPPPAAGVRNPDRPVRPARPRRGPRVVQGRRSRRVVRRIDTWTVFKLSFLFYLCGGLIVLIAGVALWNIAGAFDVITNVEKFIQKLFDLQSFKLQADAILGYSAIGAAVLVLLGTGANVLMALLYNLISDVIGGVQVIVLEETDIDSQTTSERAKGRIRGRTDDRITRRRDRPPADDAAVSP